MARLGVLGGTFDPPHIGHLILAQCALEYFQFDRVIFIPANKQPHKLDQPISAGKIRLEMLKLALADDKHFEISAIELDDDSVSYTCQTLHKLKALYPKYELYFIMGGDNITDIQTWKNPEEIFLLAEVVAAHRPAFPAEGEHAGQIKLFPMPQIEISSTAIRENVKQGKAIKYLVADSVEKYIIKHNLYK